jgi:hypothetical protein
MTVRIAARCLWTKLTCSKAKAKAKASLLSETLHGALSVVNVVVVVVVAVVVASVVVSVEVIRDVLVASSTSGFSSFLQTLDFLENFPVAWNQNQPTRRSGLKSSRGRHSLLTAENGRS